MNIEQEKLAIMCVSIVACWTIGFVSGWFINRDEEECVIFEENCVVEIDSQQHKQCVDALMVAPETRLHLIQAYCGI